MDNNASMTSGRVPQRRRIARSSIRKSELVVRPRDSSRTATSPRPPAISPPGFSLSADFAESVANGSARRVGFLPDRLGGRPRFRVPGFAAGGTESAAAFLGRPMPANLPRIDGDRQPSSPATENDSFSRFRTSISGALTGKPRPATENDSFSRFRQPNLPPPAVGPHPATENDSFSRFRLAVDRRSPWGLKARNGKRFV